MPAGDFHCLFYQAMEELSAGKGTESTEELAKVLKGGMKNGK